MVSTGSLGLSALCLLAYISFGDAECGTASNAKLDVCVGALSTANVLNLQERKDRIAASNTSCPVDILKNSCTSFNAMMKCVNLAGFPEGCEGDFNQELKNQQFECTYLELGDLCPDAEKIGGASSVVASLSLIVASVAVAIYNKQ